MLVADDLAVSHLFVVNVLCKVVPSNDEKVPAATLAVVSSRFQDFHSLRHQFKSIFVPRVWEYSAQDYAEKLAMPSTQPSRSLFFLS